MVDWIIKNWAFLFSAISAALLAIWNLWQNRKIEKLKSELNQKLLVHRLQFETEFNTYKEVWANLVVLRKHIESLRPIADVSDPNKTYEETISDRLMRLRKETNETVSLILSNEPFYPPLVKEKLMNVISAIKEELVAAGIKKSGILDTQYWLKKEVIFQGILISISEACESIRKRVGTSH